MHHPFSLLRLLPRIICLIGLALVLQGCSVVKLAYNQAPELLYWRFDSYIDFTDAQAPRAREELARFAQWHRNTQLPEYITLLQKVQQTVAAPAEAPQVCTLFEQARSKVAAMTLQIEPAVLWLASTVSAEQLQHLERKYAQTNTEWRQEWLDVSAQAAQKKRYEFFVKRAELVYETLQDGQKAALQERLAQTGFDVRMIYAERLRNQQDQLQTLRRIAQEKLPPPQAQEALRGYLARSLSSPNAQYRRYQEQAIAQSCAVFAAVHNAASPAHRQQAVARLKGYEDDLRALLAP